MVASLKSGHTSASASRRKVVSCANRGITYGFAALCELSVGWSSGFDRGSWLLKLQIPRGSRMNMHKNARLTPLGRERIVRQVERGQTLEAVAEGAGVCSRTVGKWVDRYRREGSAGLQDRSSRPHRLRQPTPQGIVEDDRAAAPPALDR